jgi:hypothetical protein
MVLLSGLQQTRAHGCRWREHTIMRRAKWRLFISGRSCVTGAKKALTGMGLRRQYMPVKEHT